MAEGDITAEGCSIVLEPVEHGDGRVTMGGTIATAQNEKTAMEIARRCQHFPPLLDAAKEALTFIEQRTAGMVFDVKDSLRAAIRNAERDENA